jgi:hypothetical protein
MSQASDSKANVTAFLCLQNGGNFGVKNKYTICHCRLDVLFMTLLFFLLLMDSFSVDIGMVTLRLITSYQCS